MSKFKFDPQKSAESYTYFTKEKLSEIVEMMEVADQFEIDPEDFQDIAEKINPDLQKNIDEVCGGSEFIQECIEHYVRMHAIINGCREVKQ